jgi:hypothetical protein
MTLTIADKDKFLNNFITPLSKVADSAVLKITKQKISTLISACDNTIIVSSEYTDEKIDAEKTLNIPDLKKLCRVLSCIEENSFDLDISANYIGYKSNSVRFKYHLYDDNIITTPKVNIEKLKALEFDGSFTLPHISTVSLVKGSTISTESNKLYISVKDNFVTGELTDKMRANIDSYGIKISDNYSGVQFNLPIPLNFEIFRIISSMRFKEIHAKLITKMGVMLFDLNLENTSFKFIISALSN